MSFIKTVADTLYSPELYTSIKEKTLRGAFGYFAKLSLTIALFGAILAGAYVSPIVSDVLSDLQKEILENYPAGLEIKIQKGVATSNTKTEPLFFPIKETWKKLPVAKDTNTSGMKKTPDYFFVLYTAADKDLTPESFKNMNTYALLTSRHFVAYDSDQGIVFKDLSQFGDATINQDNILRLFTLSRFIPLVIPFLYFVSMFFGIFLLSIFMVFAGFVFLIIQKIMKNDISYETAYKTSLYASTVPIVLSVLFVLSGLPNNVVLWLLTLMTLLVSLLNSKPGKAVHTS
jgi:Protein of unknown function (DUF1189)